jgi:hypothetical protein
MIKFWFLWLVVLPPLGAADFVLAGRLEGVTHGSISIRLGDGREVNAVLPAGIAVPYNAGDQVALTCAPAKPVYDAQAGLHYHLTAKSVRLVRTATPEEHAEVMVLLAWKPQENLLYRPAPAAAESPLELERVRKVNLEYVSKMPSFVADEAAKRYRSASAEKPWNLHDTIDDEVTFKGGLVDHQNIRQNGKPFHHPFSQIGFVRWYGGFGIELKPLFERKCPTKIDFAGADTADGLEVLAYLFRSPPKGCFGSHTGGSRDYNPARSGRFLVDAGSGSLVRYQEETFGYPADFTYDRVITTQSWGYVRIGEQRYLLPVAFELVLMQPNGSAAKVSVEYKNHRHFEAATSITFGQER